jgi:hypothetical protein
MQSFSQFFSNFLNTGFDLPRTHTFFVFAQHEQHRVLPFVSDLFFKNDGVRVATGLVQEQLKVQSDQALDQLSIFAVQTEEKKEALCVWLDDFLVAPESSFLTATQKQAFFQKFQQLCERKTLFLGSLSQKDADLFTSFIADEGIQVDFVKVPERMSFEDFSLCAALMDFSSNIELHDIFSLSFELSFDHALILLDHVSCMSKKTWEKSKDYLFALVSDAGELRELSEFFWTRNAKRFFAEWGRVQSEYPEGFWTSYWSNQFFLAYFYIDRAENSVKATPQGTEHALAPSFTWKNGWKKYSKSYCFSLHKHLFELDFELKNGSELSAFEGFFAAHFLAAERR